jgi:hypothetical protein
MPGFVVARVVRNLRLSGCYAQNQEGTALILVRSSGFFFNTYSTAYNGAANTNCGGNAGSTDADVDADTHQQA